MKPKLLVTTTTFLRYQGDTEPRFVYDLSKQLLKYFDVTVLAPADPSAKLQENMEGLKVIRYRYAPLSRWETLAYPGAIVPRIKEKPVRALLVPFLLLGLYRESRRILSKEKIDCVHTHWVIPQGLIQSFFQRKNDPPYVITAHGGDVSSLNSGIFRWLKQRALNRAEATTIVSNSLKDKLLEKYELDNKTIEVISMGCDLGRFTPKHRIEGYFKHFGLDGPVILFVGRLAEKKGLEYLIRALKIVASRDYKFSLAIVGEGPEKSRLEMLVNESGLDHCVKFLGVMNHDQLPAVYASADIFCAPSVVAKDGDVEGLPTVILEASSSGLPVVSTNVSGIPEAVINGQTGILVEEKDTEALAHALMKLLSSEELQIKMGEQGRQHVSKFDWDNIGERFAEILLTAIKVKQQY